MSNKLLLPIVYLGIFLVTMAVSKGHAVRIEEMGQFLGLGGVAVGYFVGKKLKK